MADYPPLNKFYTASYAANDRDFPIVAIRLDPRTAGYRIPEDLSPHPDSKRYPNHVFTGAQPSSGDQVVTHVYEILPSPYVPFTRYDDDLGPIQGRRRDVKNEGQEASLAADKRTTYEAREGSAIVYTEIEEEWSIKTDEDGNSLFPIRDRDFYDASRGAVQERRQLFVPTGEEEGSLENVNGVITQTSYEPYNEFLSVKIVQTYKVDGPLLIGRATDEARQLATVTTQRKGATDYVPPNPTATRTVEVSREDAESLVERVVEVPEVFGAEAYRKTREDITPQKFKAAQEDTVFEQTVEGTANPNIVLGAGEFVKSEEQINKFTKRVATTSRSITSAVELSEKVLTPQGQIGTRLLKLDVGDQSFDDALLQAGRIVDASVEALGDGRTVKTETVVPSVFAGKTIQKTRTDLTPEKFKAKQEDTTTEETIAGTINPAITLGVGEFRKSEEQVTEFVKRISTTNRDTSTTQSLSESLVTAQGQIATRTLNLVTVNPDNPPTLTPDELTVDASIEALGDGRVVITNTRVPNVFPNKTNSIERPDPAPQKFRVDLPTTTTQESVVGELTEGLSLEDDEIAKTEEQQTEFVKRTSTTKRDSAPSGTLVGKRTGTWGEETVTETYNEDGTIQVGHTILSNQKTPLGGNKFLGEKVQVLSPLSLTEVKKDAETGIVTTTVKTLVAANTPIPTTTANQIAEITPIDAYNSIQIITSVNANSLPSPEVFESSIDVAYPDVLEAIGIEWDVQTGGGAGSAGISNISAIIERDLGWNSSANASASSQVVGAVFTQIRRGHRGAVRARVTRTYSLNPPTTVPTVTRFAPVYGTVTIKGRGLRITNTTEVGGFGNAQSGSSSSFQRTQNTFVDSVQIGPFCHSSPTLQNPTSPSGATTTFTASGGSVPAGAYPATSAQATATASAALRLPTSNPLGSALVAGYSHIASVRVEKWRFGIWIREVYEAFHP
jgi:hypothetical protein